MAHDVIVSSRMSCSHWLSGEHVEQAEAPKTSTRHSLSPQLPVYSHSMRAILAGGGTGGHVIPALAIAQEIRKAYGAEVLFIGTARGIENRLVPAAGFPLQLVRVGALNKVSLKTRLKTLFDLPRAVWDARRILAEFRPDIVIGVGGYASGPAMLAAILKRIPTLAFEAERRAGLCQPHRGQNGFRCGSTL